MLTYTQRKQIDAIKLDMPLSHLLALIALDFAVDFRENVKQFETVDNKDPDNPKSMNSQASNYKSQMLNLCNRMINQSDGKLIENIKRIFITLTGRSTYTFDQVTGANLVQFTNFIKTGNPANAKGYEGIKLIFEHLAGTTKEGKTEYDSL